MKEEVRLTWNTDVFPASAEVPLLASSAHGYGLLATVDYGVCGFECFVILSADTLFGDSSAPTQMNAARSPFMVLASVSLGLLCSCATGNYIRSTLPPETFINRGAGRDDALLLTVCMESGEELTLGVDTGAPYTLLDSSLEPKLGERLRVATIRWLGGKTAGGLYRAPKLYLGSIRLLTGPRIATADMSKFGYPGPLMGILGMDCLRNFCIQLDFIANRWRFLDPANLHTEDLGQPFPLMRKQGCFATRENLVGVKGAASVIDTGCNFDGVLTPKLFQQWTNRWESGELSPHAGFPNGRFGGATYTNLNLHGDGDVNIVGLSFLARHLVTFNFPKRTMYLKRVRAGPNAEPVRKALPAKLERGLGQNSCRIGVHQPNAANNSFTA